MIGAVIVTLKFTNVENVMQDGEVDLSTSHSELMREIQRLNKEVSHFIDLLMGYHSFTAKIHKANHPYVKMTVPVYTQEALDLVGGEIVDVKIKVLKRNKVEKRGTR